MAITFRSLRSTARRASGTSLALLGAALAVGSMSTPAQAEVTYQSDRFEQVSFNPCSGEDVAISGRTITITDTKQLRGGGFSVRVHVLTLGRGQGQDTGARYFFGQASTFFERVSENGSDIVSTENLRIIGAGEDDDLVMDALVVVRVNAEGETAVDISESRLTCR